MYFKRYIFKLCRKNFLQVFHSLPLRPRSFWSAPRIATSRPVQRSVQRHSGFEWLCKHNRLRSEPIRFVKLDSEHAQSDGKSVNRGHPVLDMYNKDFYLEQMQISVCACVGICVMALNSKDVSEDQLL